MTTGRFRFAEFVLDPEDRQLRRSGEPVDVNGRYLDALVLLVREQGRLVSKDRFMDEVWRGIPVTDEALTQCVKNLRRHLGDSAARPRFIETVAKHGYRFIAPVEIEPSPDVPVIPIAGARSLTFESRSWREFIATWAAGTAGGAVAGLLGGMFYGFGAAYQPGQAGMGAVSVLGVLVMLTVILAVIGAAGVSLGIAAACIYVPRWTWFTGGGAVGGIIVGAIVKLLGLDAFNLLFGRSPGEITGAAEGALLGGAVGLAAWLALSDRAASLRRGMILAGLCGGAAGIAINLAGGRLLGGSLDLLARSFPGSRLRLDPIGRLFGEGDFGPVARILTGGIEGMLFGACIVGAMIVARREMGRKGPSDA